MRLECQNNILILILFFISFPAAGQITGYIYDYETKKPLESVNIFNNLNKNGTSTDKDGNFTIISSIGSALSISSVGYKKKEYIIRKHNPGIIYLNPLSEMINEIMVVIKEDPAIDIMKQVIEHNNYKASTDRLPNRKELLKIYLNDKEKIIPPLRNSITFQAFSDSLEGNVPFYISTKYYKDSELIEEWSSGISIQKEYFKNYINAIDLDYEIEKEKINILGRSITSPISRNALSYYNYYLYDSCFVNNEYCYKIKVNAKNSNSILFNGFIWVNTISFEIQKTEIFLDNKLINFIENLSINQVFNGKYSERNQKKKSIQFSISLSDLHFSDSLKMIIKKDIHWLQEKEENLDISNKELLLEKEIAIIDSINKDTHIKITKELSELFISSYFSLDIIDVGPIYEILSNNEFEGQRISLLARTNKEFLENTLISGYIGKGTQDKRKKYGIDIRLRNKAENSLQIAFIMKSDIEYIESSFIQHSLDPNRLNYSSESLLYSLFRRSNKDEMTYFRKNEVSLTKESNRLDITLFYNEKLIEKNRNLLINENLHQSNAGLKIRYSLQKKVKNHFNIINVRSQFPIFFGKINFSRNNSSAQSSFKLQLATLHTINTSIFGRTKYLLDLGFIRNNDYSSLYNLEIHRGNESYIYDFKKSSLMNKHEFISDRYSSLYMEQHLNGKILNKIPIIREMELREVLHANIILGNIHDESNLDNIPENTTALNYKEPYIEIGIGIENIFRILRINAIWRLSHLNNNITKFGIFGSIYFSL